MNLTDSFYGATARERAVGIADPGTFTELLGPENPVFSPHLGALGKEGVPDDGIVTGLGLCGTRPLFLISMEGRFIGGSLGEVGGAKMTGMLELALGAYNELTEKYGKVPAELCPAVVISYDTGGVRLHEANTGLLALAEVMDLLQELRGKVPVIALIGSKVGSFGGMGFVSAAADRIIMSEAGRMGLTGPEVIEEEMGKEEFDASDKAMILRITGGKHKYLLGDCGLLVEDSLGAFRQAVRKTLALSNEELAGERCIGSADLVRRQLALLELAVAEGWRDPVDAWRSFGNENPEDIPAFELDAFLAIARRWKGKEMLSCR